MPHWAFQFASWNPPDQRILAGEAEEIEEAGEVGEAEEAGEEIFSPDSSGGFFDCGLVSVLGELAVADSTDEETSECLEQLKLSSTRATPNTVGQEVLNKLIYLGFMDFS